MVDRAAAGGYGLVRGGLLELEDLRFELRVLRGHGLEAGGEVRGLGPERLELAALGLGQERRRRERGVVLHGTKDVENELQSLKLCCRDVAAKLKGPIEVFYAGAADIQR